MQAGSIGNTNLLNCFNEQTDKHQLRFILSGYVVRERYNSGMTTNQLTHLDETGRARMVDVGHKPDTERIAVARGERGRGRPYEHVAHGDAERLPRGTHSRFPISILGWPLRRRNRAPANLPHRPHLARAGQCPCLHSRMSSRTQAHVTAQTSTKPPNGVR